MENENIISHAYNEDGQKMCVVCHDSESVANERDDVVRDFELTGVFFEISGDTQSVTIFLCGRCAGDIYDSL